MSKGSVRKRGSSYTIIYDEPPGPDGKRRQRWVSGFRTQKQAQAALTKILHELQTGTYVEPDALTVKGYFERWFTDAAAQNVNAHTLEGYRWLAARYVIPHLGGRQLQALRPMDIQALYTQLLATGGQHGKPLSASTVRHVHVLLSQALKQAVRWQVLAHSPMEGVRPPRATKDKPAVLKDRAAIDALLETASGTWLYMPVVLGLGAALRLGEVCALKWTDIDFDAGTVTVRTAMQELGGKLIETTPKTDESQGTIDLPQFVLRALRQHQVAQSAYLLSKGVHPRVRYVITLGDGSPRQPGNLSHAFGKLADQAGCPEVTFHGLRHSCATYLLEIGTPAHVVSSVLRHANVTVTLSIYAHVLRGQKERTAADVDRFLGSG